MIPRELLATAMVPGGGEQLRLFRRGADYMIVLDRNELMNSRMSGSEQALANMTIERLGNRDAHLLIGGYGMGFTLRAACDALSPKGKITIVELVPEVVAWAKRYMPELSGDALADPRVELIIADVADVIREGTYDAILLDVDNGPDGLTRDANNRLYSAPGLRAAMTALKRGGILAVWSAAPDRHFTRRLDEAGFAIDEVTTTARANGKGARHTIWFAQKP
ncbi:spermidine synthase [Sphingomonas sp.]|uniref:spermidine synthase n=1 Tax=Sphingomonas sp. TaxID=28214 RepID=UPI00286C6677|nr:spermidine synthase [Sphingomonas sp.]